MARVSFANPNEITGKAKEAYEKLAAAGKLTNMKQALLQDYATYDAFMAWYTSWDRLVEVVGERAATIYAHAVSSTNGCLLCSLFFISDLAALGEDSDNINFSEDEQLLADLGAQIVKDPTNVSDEIFEQLKKKYTDSEIVAIVGFAAQMMATNNFNSVLRIDVDERLLPIRDKFRPATWRADIK
ncbi:MAG: carboxymuconolactone decarboxylase family protein [Candidatus Faecivicinus sp.]